MSLVEPGFSLLFQRSHIFIDTCILSDTQDEEARKDGEVTESELDVEGARLRERLAV